ncbi:TonB-dependent receptor [Gaoshiqia sp. Z1-71]|uniref:TonB-dependent receptor n=1 Tax=Gaoshiqia hydrogeniformans TaxID=3290090 RepID=UPI003BF809A9
MRIVIRFLFLLFIVQFTEYSFGQSNNATVHGKITGTNGQAIDLANISIKGFPLGTVSDQKGNYLLRIPAKRKITLVFSVVGYVSFEKEISAEEEQRIELNVTLSEDTKEIDEVRIDQQRKGQTNIAQIDPHWAANLPGAGAGSIEALLKTLPGVSSNNELSSQYSVRGGNFDENLVYVNDIEIYRPFLVRAGQQEGLSFINPDLVSSVSFSAGGFDAKYGDKTASVLDIKYRRPNGFRGSVSASMLGGSVHVEDNSKNNKLSYIGGLRYKTNSYLLNSLDESGEYDPRFTDLQAYVSYRISGSFDLSFLGNLARNDYHFVPKTRETTFGTWSQPLQTKIYFSGQEKDEFMTRLGALSANFHPISQLNLKLITSVFETEEEVSYDILGKYYLNELERDLASGQFGDSVLNIGIGSFLNHARNKLEARVISLAHKGAFNSDQHLLNWGIDFRSEKITDQIHEWEMRDSAGYSLPYSGSEILLYRTVHTDNRMNSIRASAYIQDTYQVPLAAGELYLTAGIRAGYWDYSDEWLLSPRFSVSYFPEWESRFVFRLSGGSYRQPAFFKELKDRDGNVYPDTKAQNSQQIVLGADYMFRAWDRPFKLSSELYYKYFSRLIPYQVENVQIRYLADQQATGYAAGLDLKVNGEFVSGIESWAGISLLQTREDITGDGHGLIPRPTDQFLNISLFFQDYLPGNPSYKLHLAAFYGSRLPTGPPNSQRYQDIFRMPPYRRVDLGLSKTLIGSESRFRNKSILSTVNDMWLTLEILNLLGINNTVSYFWVSSNYGDMFAVPNYLTDRKINLKLTVKF